ncbi:MAG: 4-hydroxythreonine-4-phosphate dehydrogenase PdxA, partial [Thermodesulfovibrionales bacterium]
MKEKKRVAITVGDPGGVGPEIVLKSISSPEMEGLCKFVVIGDSSVIEEAMKLMNLSIDHEAAEFIDMGIIKDSLFIRNRPSATNGLASVTYLKKATELALNGYVNAIVTAPISKESWKMAGFSWPGHTEMLAELTST